MRYAFYPEADYLGPSGSDAARKAKTNLKKKARLIVSRRAFLGLVVC